MRSRRAILLGIACLCLLTGMLASTEPDPPVRFATTDLLIESDAPLAAYQVEILYDKTRAEIVGLENGEAPFAQAPYYDPAGRKGGRIVVAAFAEDDDRVRAGRVRVARIHWMIRHGKALSPRCIIETAATVGGRKIDVTAILRETPADADGVHAQERDTQ